jgi:hypothetical protein
MARVPGRSKSGCPTLWDTRTSDLTGLEVELSPSGDDRGCDARPIESERQRRSAPRDNTSIGLRALRPSRRVLGSLEPDDVSTVERVWVPPGIWF